LDKEITYLQHQQQQFSEVDEKRSYLEEAVVVAIAKCEEIEVDTVCLQREELIKEVDARVQWVPCKGE